MVQAASAPCSSAVLGSPALSPEPLLRMAVHVASTGHPPIICVAAVQAASALCSSAVLGAWLEDPQRAGNAFMAAAALAGKLHRQGQHGLVADVHRAAAALLSTSRWGIWLFWVDSGLSCGSPVLQTQQLLRARRKDKTYLTMRLTRGFPPFTMAHLNLKPQTPVPKSLPSALGLHPFVCALRETPCHPSSHAVLGLSLRRRWLKHQFVR